MKSLARFFILSTLIFSTCLHADEGRDLCDKAEELKMKLNDDDEKVLKNGDLGTGRYVVGGIIGTYPIGFGVGHIIQGRWGSDGWKFTAGELASLGLLAAGASNCISDAFSNIGNSWSGDCKGSGMMTAGIIGFAGFRIWEIVDVWYGGYRQMDDYTYLKNKINGQDKPKTTYFVLPNILNGKTGLAFGMTF